MRARILFPVRHLAALDRLLDVLPVLADDMRVETRFATAEGSEFSADLTHELRRTGANITGWPDSGDDFDLAISPSANGPLHKLKVPLLTIPHGAGHHKLLATETGVSDEVSGLARSQLMHEGRLVPTAIGLSHVDDLAILRRDCPEALPHAEVVGDPCFARLGAGIPSQDHYREALGTGQRSLIVLASTWGPFSLFRRQADLARRLVEELPAAEYQVALILHPNIWNKYQDLQLRTWLDTALRNGLILVPRLRAWQPVLIAASVLISDHGSLAFYGACLGKPLLLGAFGESEVVPKSPMALLGELAERLDPNRDLRSQLDAARPVPGRRELTELTFQDNPYLRLRTQVYRLLDLDEPPWPAIPPPVGAFTP